MIAALLASAVLARQNPAPPYVRVPPGWRFINPGWGIKGPRGNTIQFPHPGSNGRIASSLNSLRRGRAIQNFVLEGRTIDIVLMDDGLLVVSFPPLATDVSPLSDPYDLWSATVSARDVVEALAIGLTRVEGSAKVALRRGTPYVPPSLPATNPSNPFPALTARQSAYVNDPKTFSDAPYNGRFMAGIRLRNGISAPVRWTVSERLADGFLSVAETKDGQLVASYTPTLGRSKVSFVAERATPETALNAVVAAITYRRPPG